MWTKKPPTSGNLRCSFCNRHEDDVQKLIAGPEAFICDECIGTCNDILADDRLRKRGRRAAHASGAPIHASIGRADPLVCQRWMGGDDAAAIDDDTADFLVATGHDAVIDLLTECDAVLSELGESAERLGAAPVGLRKRICLLAEAARALGLVSDEGSFFESDRRTS